MASRLSILLPWIALAEYGCGGDSCRVGDTTYPDGAANVPAPDGCNTCTCDDGKLSSCTTAACPE
jgi:hypothetical protein